MNKLIHLRHYLLNFGILLTLVVNYSFGQGYQTFYSEQEMIAREARWKLGPFYLFPGVNMNFGYDNNIYQQTVESSPIADYTSRFSPRITAYLISKNSFTLSITEIPEYVYYFELENERGWNNIFSADGKLLLLKRFVLNGNFGDSRIKERISSEFNVPTYVNTKSLRVGLFYETFRGTSIGFSYIGSARNYEDIILLDEEINNFKPLDRKERNGNVEFYYRIFSEGQFFLKVGYTDYKFDSPEAQFKNSHSYEIRSGIQFPLLGKIRGALSVGYKKLIPEEEGIKGYSGLVGNTSLEIRIRRFNFRLAYLRDIPFSYGSAMYFIENRYGVGISYYTTQFLRLNYDFNYSNSDYPDETSTKIQDDNFDSIYRKFAYWSHRVGFTHRIIENLGIGLFVDLWKRTLSYSSTNSQRILVGANLTYDF